VSRLSNTCGILNISQLYTSPRPATGIALLYLDFARTEKNQDETLVMLAGVLTEYRNEHLPRGKEGTRVTVPLRKLSLDPTRRTKTHSVTINLWLVCETVLTSARRMSLLTAALLVSGVGQFR
jgi:hypothetical protein